jgi:hypothetical protein
MGYPCNTLLSYVGPNLSRNVDIPTAREDRYVPVTAASVVNLRRMLAVLEPPPTTLALYKGAHFCYHLGVLMTDLTFRMYQCTKSSSVSLSPLPRQGGL